MKKEGLMHELKKNKLLFLMLLPGILYFFVFQYIPMSGIVIAFKQFRFDKGIFHSPWVGFDNFDFFFRSGKAWIITRNTILYNLAFMATGLILQLATALFIAEIGRKFVKKYIQTTLLFPFFISWVVVGTFIYNLFNFEYGIINHYLKDWGMEPVDIYSSSSSWSYIIVFFNNWKYIGYNSLIYLAAIYSIDKSLYEAAEIDGAGIMQRIRLITLPLLMPTIMILLLLAVGQLFRGNFELFYNVVGNNSLLYNQTDVIDTFVFRSLIQSADIGMTAAAGLYQAVLCLVIILVTNFTIKKYNSDYSLF
ncbi:sugar ABC transporter permease [Paenibacillus sp. F411]|uniref:Binding-protein-dependent transport system inner membrane component n=1 Tax=Paenibacillus algicola TaxID=2565926 RepID=A0A4P8XHM1_9BACL|nr:MULTISPECIES: ABC transporter permease subunit [Paenibacillus]MBO2943391.1 sugar ABC transporter permease [Paenibacillus sp. F411]QCT02037.1 binding-protein-dependent transport system inner membrane component [Paenibacillus algicola]